MEALQNNMKCLYYKNLETYAKKHKIDINIPNYNKTIEIKEITEVSDISDISETVETVETVETEVANNTETYTEDFVYKKPWNKLNIIHKKIKLDEYVNNLDIEDSEIKKHLKSQFASMLKNKKLTKKNEVEYDAINGKIISISSLKYKNNNYNISD
jgi:hypothetical protein